jgi:hypothetical protein
VVDPATTVTDGGTTTAGLLLLSMTVVAELVALLNVATQMLDPEGDIGLQTSDVSVGVDVSFEGMVSVPPLPDSVIALAAPDAAAMFTRLSDDVWEAVTLMIATTPSAIVVALIPYAIQVYKAVPALHVTDFPAAVNAGPAVAEIELIPTAGYWKVHCRAAIEFAPDVNVRLRDALPVAVAVADERLRLCA